MQINSERLADIFVTLCEIDSPSRKEGRVCAYLKEFFATRTPGATLFEDNSNSVTGSDCGNLIVRFEGELDKEPVFLNAHMDTVAPGEGVKVQREGDIFKSHGETVLGGDDKSGIAILCETILSLQEKRTPYRPVEFIFTTCEEIGLLGAKNLESSLVQSSMGVALDSVGTDEIIIGAPAANRIFVEIQGVSAHAGLHPEDGVNAIQVASQCLIKLPLGRIDVESTANIGLIAGGTATNIIPDHVSLKGEIRSHCEKKLRRLTKNFHDIFQGVIDQCNAGFASRNLSADFLFQEENEYPAMKLTPQDQIVQLLLQASEAESRKLDLIVAGGGSDANIFNRYHGLTTVIVGTGMEKVHTTDERIRLADMVRQSNLVYSLLSF
ncbi:MAG: M20/M25/M40 family metallo-hydrolase [Desulfobulbaceae bacterium]|nr:M20/M25/M40 family metallo-hydrolase [Desulfobulbaceae bacterium]